MAELYGSAVANKYRDQAYQTLAKYNLDPWSDRKKELFQSQKDFGNYLSSGNYNMADNQKYRDMANKAVADLTEEQKNYAKNSNQYKTLDAYKNYYSGALGNFDRLDVGAAANDYITSDSWHSADDYAAASTSLKSSMDSLQKEMDALGETESDDYKQLKSTYDWYDSLYKGMEKRQNDWDAGFEDADDYAAWERSKDYKNYTQAQNTLETTKLRLERDEARLKELEKKFQFITSPKELLGNDLAEWEERKQLYVTVEEEKANIEQLTADLERVEKWQKRTAAANLYDQYGENGDYQKVLDDLIEARNKAPYASEERAKIDIQIRALAGDNETGLDANGLYDTGTLYGRSVMRNFDVDSAKAEVEEIDKRLEELGLTTNRTWATAAWAAGGKANNEALKQADDKMRELVENDENLNPERKAQILENSTRKPGEDDPEVMELRRRKTELTRLINSAENVQGKISAEGELKGLSEEERQRLTEAGKLALESGNNLGYLDNRDIKNLGDDDSYLRDLIYVSAGLEAEGKQLGGLSTGELVDLYTDELRAATGRKWAKAIDGIDMLGGVPRWLAQVGLSSVSGVYNFGTGMAQLTQEEDIPTTAFEVLAQAARSDLSKYGDGRLFANSSQGGSNISQLLFDVSQTTFQMLPTIGLSYLLTKAGLGETAVGLISSGVMGASSGGNTYRQAVKEGWDKDDARAYATILGAAEGGMQYAIGGISAYGGVGEEQLLNACKGINNAGLRFVAETGIHIGSETVEELAQNRLERYLSYNVFDQGDADWMSWNDDDWYTVVVTAMSTGALEGPNAYGNTFGAKKLGEQLSGQRAIPSKSASSRTRANNALIAEVGSAMKSQAGLEHSLIGFATNPDLVDINGSAFDLASKMESGKLAKNAMNLGNLYREILSEYYAKNGNTGVQSAMAGIIGGAVQYNKGQEAWTAIGKANEQVNQVRRENKDALVLDMNATELMRTAGVSKDSAIAYGAILNKVMSGTNLSEAEIDKLLGDSTTARASLRILERLSNDSDVGLKFRLDKESATEAIREVTKQFRDEKAAAKQAAKEAISQAQQAAVDKTVVNEAAANADPGGMKFGAPQDLVKASTVKAVQKADTELEAATRRLEQLKKMSFKELANSKLLGEGGAEILVNAATDQDMRQQMATLQDRAEKLSAVRFPSQAQRTELADIREQQAALKEQIVANAESARSQLEARASTNASRGSANVAQGSANAAPAANTAAAPAEAAQITSTDTIIVPGTGARMSREGFVQNYMAQNPGVTLEQANERFDQYAEQTGAVTKGTVENGQTADQDQERNDVGERGDRTEDQGRSDQSEQAAERSGADEFEELRTDGSRPEDAPAARVTKGASRVTDDNIEVITDSYADLPELTASLKRSGFKKITYILDGDLVNDLGDSVAAVYNNGELFLRLDYPRPGYDYVGTAEHERLHLQLELMRAKFGDEDGKAFVSTTLQSLLGREAFTKAFDAYAKVYGPVYLASGLSVDEVAHMICEEMLCDMVGGINNFGTDLGDYLEDAEGILEASKFNVVMQNLVDNPSGDPGTVIMEEIDKNALPYGIPADTLISTENVDSPSTAPANVEQTSKFAFFGLAEALGFKVDKVKGEKVYYLNDEDARLGQNGFTQVTVDMIKQSPIGDLIRYSVDKGDITADEAEQQYNLFASIASITDQTHDFYQAMQFMGSTIFTAMKANSDKQYGTTYDFPSICTKTQAIINEMSAQMVAKGRSLTEDEIIEAYNNVFNDGNPVPCPECYVFSRWVGIGGLLDNIRSYQDRFGKMSVDEVIAAYDEANKEVLAFAEENGLSKGRAKGSLASKLDKQFKSLEESIQTKENQGEAVAEKDYETRDKLAARMATIRSLTWIDDVYFGGKAHKASNVNPNFAVPLEVLYDLNEGETFARDYKEAWAFRTTQGAGYGKAITPYAEAILGEGMLVTTNTTKSIKAKANGNLNNPYQTERGKITENSARGKNLKAARQKELNQLFIGGQRLQSTSDARFDNAVDYLLSALELQTMHSGAQVYTKVPGAVAFFNACKYCTNMSMMPKGGGLDANGNPVDTNVGGMDLATMMMLRKRFEYAGSITIGVNDAHIRALMAQEFRDFIIPYHASGGKMTLIESFRQTQDPDLKGTTIRSSDYTKTQSDKILNDDVLRDSLGKSEKEIEDIHKFRDTRLWILTDGKSGAYHSEILNPYEDGITEAQSNARRVLQGMYASMQEGGKWNGVKLAKGKVEHQIFPNEFWDVSSTYENSSVNTQRYLDYCDALGFLHRFSGKTVTYNRKTGKSEIVPVTGYDQNGNKIPLTDLAYKNGTDGEIEPFFWKTLTDRRMYGNNGQYLEQPNVDLTNLKAETVTTFAAPMGERRYNHRVSMTNAAARAANVSRMSIQANLRSDLEAVRDRTFSSATDEVLIGDTSAFLVNELDFDPLPNYMPASKAYRAIKTRDEAVADGVRVEETDDYHGLGVDGLYNLLEKAETPIAAIIGTETVDGEKRDNRLILVTDQEINGGLGVVVVEPNTTALSGRRRVTANKYITAYDKQAIVRLVQEAARNNGLLYINKESGQIFDSGVSGSNRPTAISETARKNNIQRFWGNVNWKDMKSPDGTYTVGAPSGTSAMQNAFANPGRIRHSHPLYSLQLNDKGYKTSQKDAPVTDDRGQVLFVEPSTGSWGVARDADGSLLNTDYIKNELGLPIYDNPHDAYVPEKRGSVIPSKEDLKHKTANGSTEPSYVQAFEYLDKTYGDAAKGMRVLDASSGLGLGTQYGRDKKFNVTELEPFPGDRAVDFRSYGGLIAAIESGEEEAFDFIINNAVINVMAQDAREELLASLIRMLKPGGQLFINPAFAKTWGAYNSAIPLEEYKRMVANGENVSKKNVILSPAGDATGGEIYTAQSKSVQKGYTDPEFMAFARDVAKQALGEDIQIVKGSSKDVPGINKGFIITRTGNPTTGSRYSVQLTEAQQKNQDFNNQQTEVGSKLKTLQGTNIQRYKGVAGKEVSPQVYVHKDYAAQVVPEDALNRAEEVLSEKYPDFQYNTIMYDKKTGNVRFDEAPDFDTAREPIAGNTVTVTPDGETKTGYSDAIWHHKWLWVGNDYQGFNVADSWNWSKQWLNTIRPVDVSEHKFNSSFSQRGIANGTGHGTTNWNEQLEYFGLPKDENATPTRSRYSIQNDSTENTNPYPENTLQHDMLEAARNGTLSEWVTEQMNAHEDALENAKIRPPVIPSKGFVPKVTAQEKAALENRRKGLIQAKGAMKPSEKSNGFALPKKDEAGNWFHRFLQNVGSAKELKVAQDQVEKFAFTDVAGTYVPDSNKADLNWAKNVISEDGLDSAVKQFNREAMKMEMPSNVTKSLALGQQLLIETSRQGDMQKFLDVLSSLTLLSSQAGKSLQAFRMLKQSGPIGELYYVQKAVKQLNERNADKITAGRMAEITVPEDLANAVLMASTQEAQDKAMDELIAGIAAQVPVTLMDKWNAWRYMAMLGNARTHVRNIIGNAVFVPLRFAKDLMAAGGELLATKTGLMEEQDRRKALVVSRELRDFAKQDALAMQKELQGSGKYNPAREILDARKILPGFLETISRKNGELLEYEDWLFLSPAYQGALSQALAHTGYSLSEMLDGSNKDAVRALNNARRIAIEEAQKATYRDFNAAASMLNRIKRMESGKTSDKVIGVLLEGILPFTKTPINILRRGVEYSPIGIASSIFEAAAGVKNGNLDVAQFIDHLSAGLSGTAVAVLGYLLASLGYIRNKKDDKEEEFDKLQGYQDYSIQIGKVSATIDWAAPTALPLFTGAAAYDMIQRDESLEWKDAWDAMMMIAEPMMSLSMLDGLNNTLSAASYADDSQKLATVASSAFTSYLGQAFPTLLGQVARSIDGTRRSTYVDKNSPVPTAIQRFVQSSVQNKIPVWEEQKIPYIDQWGREDTVSSKFLGAMENFLSPSYVNIVHTTDVDATLRELYDATKDSGVLPSTAAKYFSVAGERKDLTADEYVSYAKDVGSTKYQLLTSLFADPRYMSLTDDQKAEAVGVIYKYATASGKYHVDQNYDLHAQGKWIEEAEAAATDVQRFNRIWEYLEEHFKK